MEVAEALNREALALWLAIGARHGIASSNYLLGGLLAGTGRVEEARMHLAEALAVAREIDDAEVIVLAAAQLALLAWRGPGRAWRSLPFTTRASHRSADGSALPALEGNRRPRSSPGSSPAPRYPSRSHAAGVPETMIVNVPLHRDIQAAWETKAR